MVEAVAKRFCCSCDVRSVLSSLYQKILLHWTLSIPVIANDDTSLFYKKNQTLYTNVQMTSFKGMRLEGLQKYRFGLMS